ncbi:MAG: adenylate/guanylate cyclase domain-containing protein, partial [Myxococcales bacterium]
KLPALRRRAWAVTSGAIAATAATASMAFASLGGLEQPWFYISYAIVPLSAVLLAPLPQRLLGTALIAVCWGAGYLLPFPAHLASPFLYTVLVFQAFVVLFTTLLGHALYHLARTTFLQRRQLEAQARALAAEREKSEALLRNILPEAVAARLKDGQRAVATRSAEVSVLFADICGFTTLSQRLPPEELVVLLDGMFLAFDALVERHGLEKIKTIGDAYMVASGVPEPRADHARAIAALALDMREAARGFRLPGGAEVQVRIGIHSGEVVAGVIGRKKFSYDLWGDTVNTASRMESHGIPGEIQLSQATVERLGDAFALERRGVVELKGKGPTETWLLKGRAAAQKTA